MTTPEQDIFIEKWCAALESGEYKQSRVGELKTNDGFCCLGVAGQLLGGDMFWDRGDSQYDAIQDALGLNSSLGYFKTDYGTDNLASLNDRAPEKGGLTFSEISVLVRTRPEGLFV